LVTYLELNEFPNVTWAMQSTVNIWGTFQFPEPGENSRVPGVVERTCYVHC
jgi:hypothetical protein